MLISSNPIMTAIRSIFVVTDVGIYALLRFMYELFFNIATFNVVDRSLIFNIISRVQLVVGVYMMFQLVLIIIKGIINPDSFSDKKTGAGNLIMRIIVSLTLLALIVPINIPSPKNEYEKQINNSGILFGTLYSLQYRILTNNTLGRIILGQEGTNYTSSNPNGQYLVTFGNRFVSVIAKSFYSLYTDDNGNYACDDKWVEEYNREDIWPEEVIVLGLKHCKGKYFLNMTMLISSVAGIVLVVIMFMMCFEVAKRVFQLAALQILAPIPIISYMDPNGSKDGAFSSWIKLLGKTYLDLFTRLTVIYFTLAVIEAFIDKFFSSMIESNLNTWQGDALAAYELNRWTFIILCIALFIFAKDAPKFFKQMLGIKGDGKFFSAFGNAMGLGATAAGAIGSFNAGRSASRMADIQNHDQAYANRFGNRAKHLAAGLVGAGKGLAAGSAAASESKGNGIAKAMAAWKAMDQVSDNSMQNGVAGSTFFGRAHARADKILQGAGNTDFDRETRNIAQLKNIEKAGKDLFSYLEGKGKTDGAGYAVTTANIERRDANGNLIERIKVADSLNDFSKRKAAALALEQQSGGATAADFDITVNGPNGTTRTIRINAHDAVTSKIEDELAYAAGQKWAEQQDAAQVSYEQAVANGMSDADMQAQGIKEGDLGYIQKARTYNEAVKDAEFTEAPELAETYSTSGATGTVDVSNLKKRFKKAGGMAVRRESRAEYKKQQADFGAIKNGK